MNTVLHYRRMETKPSILHVIYSKFKKRKENREETDILPGTEIDLSSNIIKNGKASLHRHDDAKIMMLEIVATVHRDVHECRLPLS